MRKYISFYPIIYILNLHLLDVPCRCRYMKTGQKSAYLSGFYYLIVCTNAWVWSCMCAHMWVCVCFMVVGT